jgi:hypothetical protein
MIEPTYLRYVYDGLNKGLLNAQNTSALPQHKTKQSIRFDVTHNS